MNHTSTVTSGQVYDSRSRAQIVTQASSLAVIMFSSIFGNILILLSVYTNYQLQEITSVFIANLACADLLLAVTGMPFTLVSSITFEWIFGPGLCDFNGTMNVLFCIASILSLTAVAIERYVAIIKPLKYYTIMTRKTVIGMVVYVWSQSILCALLPIFGWSRYKFYQMESMCTGHWSNSMGYTIFLDILNFVIPLCIMVYCYYHILKAARHHVKRVQPITVGEIIESLEVSALSSTLNSRKSVEELPREKARMKKAAEKKFKQDTKAAKTLFIVMGTFVFCWTPYTIGMLCSLFPACIMPDKYLVAATWLALMNSGCNPIIYGVLNRRFRHSFKKILLVCCPHYNGQEGRP